MADIVAQAEAFEDDMRALFRRHDVNSDGALSPDEMAQLLEALGLLAGPAGESAAAAAERKARAVKDLFARFDDNNDGKVVFEEFKAHYNLLKKAQLQASTAAGAGAVPADEPAWICKRHKLSEHDAFISYRVACEKDVAAMLQLTLEASEDVRAKVFLDQKCLVSGEPWEAGFRAGLLGSRLIIYLISRGSLEGILKADGRKDNFLLEMEMGLAQAAAGRAKLLPLLVGKWIDADGDRAFLPFKCPPLTSFPDLPHNGTGPNVRETMTKLFTIQGEKVDPTNLDAVMDVINAALCAAPLPRGGGGATTAAAAVPSESAVQAPAAAVAAAAVDPNSTQVIVNADGNVREPPSFDAQVAPGESIAAALKKVRPGGSLLLLPGEFKEAVTIGPKEVHVFGRSKATLRTAAGEPLTCLAAKATVDGLIVRRDEGGEDYGIWVKSGKVRLQNLDVISLSAPGLAIQGATADPAVINCKIHDCTLAAITVRDGGKGRIEGCELHTNKASAISILSGSDPLIIRNKMYKSESSCVIFSGPGTHGRFELNEVFENEAAGVEIKDGSDPTIINNRFHDQMSGVYVDTESKGTILDNDIWGSTLGGIILIEKCHTLVRNNRVHDGAKGVMVRGAGTAVVLEGNEVFNNDDFAVEICEGARVELTKNRVHDSHYGVGIGGEGTEAILIENDVCNALEGSNVAVLDGAAATLMRNVIHDGLDIGVLIKGPGTTCTLTGNKISGHAGINVEASDAATATLIDNHIFDGQKYGVGIGNEGTTARLEGNDIERSKGGVAILAGGNATVVKNRIHDNHDSGLILNAVSASLLQDNVIERNAEGGVWLQDLASPTLIGNTIRDHVGKNARGVYFSPTAGDGAVLRGNIFSGNEGGDVADDDGARKGAW